MGLDQDSRYKFKKADICSPDMSEIFEKYQPDIVFNFAAESHVDRSIDDSSPFFKTNVVGTLNLLEASLKSGVSAFVQISTDEVYGGLSNMSPSSKETDKLAPSSAYAASKTSAEQIALHYYNKHALPVIVTRSANNFGRYQFPEKLLPLFITNLMEGKKVPLMWSSENPGLNIRDWLPVKDNCGAIWFLSQNGKPGEIYNIAGGNERTNAEVTKTLLDIFKVGEEMIDYIPHRQSHDFRYSVDDSKLRSLGFEHTISDFETELRSLVEWHKKINLGGSP